jgi:hypothetical protein
MNFKNRITRYENVPAKDLKANPFNFRTHSDRQRNVVTGLLDEIGWVDTLIVNERTGLLLDGHLRLEQALLDDQDVPVLYVDLNEQEEALALTTLDKSAELAGVNSDNLEVLVSKIDVHDVAVRSFVEDLQVDVGIDAPSEDDDAPKTEHLQFTLRFENEDEKESFYDLLRFLKEAYPDVNGVGARFQHMYQEVSRDDD